jgi:hypothetical protein
MESMSTGQASNIVIIFNQVQTDGTRVPWIWQEFGRKCIADLIAIIIFFFIRFNGLHVQSVLPFSFLRGIARICAMLRGRETSYSGCFFICLVNRVFGMLILCDLRGARFHSVTGALGR